MKNHNQKTVSRQDYLEMILSATFIFAYPDAQTKPGFSLAFGDRSSKVLGNVFLSFPKQF